MNLLRVLILAVCISNAAAFAPLSVPSLRATRSTQTITMMGKNAKDGIFTPLVKAARSVLGESTLTKVRGDVIAAHSKVIAAFCESSESAVGKIALKQLYVLADKDGNGKIDKEELQDALFALGFTHLSDEQIAKIFERADVNGNTEIDFEEFMAEAPKTLRTNLTKLAKENGNSLGFLS